MVAFAVLIVLAWASGHMTGRLAKAFRAPFQFSITVAVLVVPCTMMKYFQAGVGAEMVVLALAVVLFMKVVSVFHACSDMRRARTHHVPSFLDMMYFIAIPTLCYQVTYPRTHRVSWMGVASLAFQLVASLMFLITFATQLIGPIGLTGATALKQNDLRLFVNCSIQLAPFVLVAWLAMFFALFHVWLNLLAEVTRFGDRVFYKKWWNARHLAEFWADWNLPVGLWMKRHVYFPSFAYLPSWAAKIWVFFVSALLHEYVCAIPLQVTDIMMWCAFWGMMAQVPLCSITHSIYKIANKMWPKADNAAIGNLTLWISFCVIGQPLAIIMYTHHAVFQA